jgi:hypothetical protein
MTSLSYPTLPTAKDNGLKTANFVATGNNSIERIDTTGGPIACSPPNNGPVPGVAGVPLPTTAATFTYGALAAGALSSLAVATGGAGYPKKAFIGITFTGAPGATRQPAGLAITDATGVVTSVVMTDPGAALTGPPTGFVYTAAMKVDDQVMLADGKYNFANQPAIFATSNFGHLLAGQIVGTDLSADSISLTLRCCYPEGWTVVT